MRGGVTPLHPPASPANAPAPPGAGAFSFAPLNALDHCDDLKIGAPERHISQATASAEGKTATAKPIRANRMVGTPGGERTLLVFAEGVCSLLSTPSAATSRKPRRRRPAASPASCALKNPARGPDGLHVVVGWGVCAMPSTLPTRYFSQCSKALNLAAEPRSAGERRASGEHGRKATPLLLVQHRARHFQRKSGSRIGDGSRLMRARSCGRLAMVPRQCQLT
jgi:hypothetical protein